MLQIAECLVWIEGFGRGPFEMGPFEMGPFDINRHGGASADADPCDFLHNNHRLVIDLATRAAQDARPFDIECQTERAAASGC